eukprot:2590150-Pleurochrysis_carterae.AAC.1
MYVRHRCSGDVPNPYDRDLAVAACPLQTLQVCDLPTTRTGYDKMHILRHHSGTLPPFGECQSSYALSNQYAEFPVSNLEASQQVQPYTAHGLQCLASITATCVRGLAGSRAPRLYICTNSPLAQQILLPISSLTTQNLGDIEQ